MPRFLYIFGYQTPRQLERSRSFWIDDEDSAGLFIEAADADQALAWGEEISERYIQVLFGGNRVSWREMDFARWIEEDAVWSEGKPIVAVGEYPSFQSWLDRYTDRPNHLPRPRTPAAPGVFRRLLRRLVGLTRVPHHKT